MTGPRGVTWGMEAAANWRLTQDINGQGAEKIFQTEEKPGHRRGSEPYARWSVSDCQGQETGG